MYQRSTSTTAVILITSGALVGCAPGTEASNWVTPEVDDTVASVSPELELPLSAYHLTDSELTALQQQKAEALADCTERYGRTIEFGGDYIRPSAGTVQWGGLFGTMTSEHAENFGYQASEDGPWSPLGGFYLRQVSNMHPIIPPLATESDSERINEIAYGPVSDSSADEATTAPSGGCIQEVESSHSYQLVSTGDIEMQLMNLAFSHEKVSSAMADWSSCMKRETGETFASVQDAIEKFALSNPTPKETKTALADVKCTSSSRWADFYYAVLVDYQLQAIQSLPDLFESALAAERGQLHEALE